MLGPWEGGGWEGGDGRREGGGVGAKLPTPPCHKRNLPHVDLLVDLGGQILHRDVLRADERPSSPTQAADAVRGELGLMVDCRK